MNQQIFVQVRFKNKTDNGIEFNDCIYFPMEGFEKVTQEEIDALKDERFNNWKQVVENPPVRAEPTKGELEAQKLQIEDAITSLESKKLELIDSIASKEAR